MKKLIKRFKSLFKKEQRKYLYIFAHAFIAMSIHLLIFLISSNNLAGSLAGTSFYLGREYTQRGTKGYIDYCGFISPGIANFVTYLLLW